MDLSVQKIIDLLNEKISTGSIAKYNTPLGGVVKRKLKEEKIGTTQVFHVSGVEFHKIMARYKKYKSRWDLVLNKRIWKQVKAKKITQFLLRNKDSDQSFKINRSIKAEKFQ